MSNFTRTGLHSERREKVYVIVEADGVMRAASGDVMASFETHTDAPDIGYGDLPATRAISQRRTVTLEFVGPTRFVELDYPGARTVSSILNQSAAVQVHLDRMRDKLAEATDRMMDRAFVDAMTVAPRRDDSDSSGVYVLTPPGR